MRAPPVQHSRGYVLLLVLLVTAILTVVVTSVYVQAENNLVTAQSVTAQQYATSRAELGLQTAIARLRQPGYGGIVLNAFTPCDLTTLGDDPFNCPSPPAVQVGPIDNGTGTPLVAGGGLQYSYVIYQRQYPANQALMVPGLLSIRAVGFYGYAGNPTTVEAIVEADIQPSKNKGVDAPGCTGGESC
ncbi:MAG: hypothetical protein HY901_15640 [Deltaproteobacteria bacterium]|nr:hypothetical protein [Deltaproteobacteria bacterium]